MFMMFYIDFNFDGRHVEEVKMSYIYPLFVMLWDSIPVTSSHLCKESFILNKDQRKLYI